MASLRVHFPLKRVQVRTGLHVTNVKLVGRKEEGRLKIIKVGCEKFMAMSKKSLNADEN